MISSFPKSPIMLAIFLPSIMGGCALTREEGAVSGMEPPKILNGASVSTMPFRREATAIQVPGTANKRISIDECVRFALEKNFSIRMAKASEKAAVADLLQAKAAFDPVVGGTVVSQKPDGQEWSGPTGSGFISKKTSIGTEIGLEAGDVYRRTGDFRSDYLKGGTSDLTLSVTQPLLQGGWGVNTTGIKLAALLKDQATAVKTAEILEMLRASESAYWSASLAGERLERQKHSLKRAEKLHEDVRVRLAAGDASQLDLLEADVALAGAQERLVAAQRAEADRLDDLWFILGVPVNQRGQDIRFGDNGEAAIIKEKPDPEASIARALTLSPAAVILVNEVRRQEVALARARHGLLPKLDLEMDLDHFSGATSESSDGTKTSSASGVDAVALLRVSMPLTFRAERAGLEKAKAELERSEASRQQAELRLRQRVSELCRALDSGQESLRVARVSLQANQKKLEEQMRRHAEGLLSTHELRIAQEEIEQAEVSELQARLALLADQASLGQLEGTLAGRHGIIL